MYSLEQAHQVCEIISIWLLSEQKSQGHGGQQLKKGESIVAVWLTILHLILSNEHGISLAHTDQQGTI